jgi:hypothetical protein
MTILQLAVASEMQQRLCLGAACGRIAALQALGWEHPSGFVNRRELQRVRPYSMKIR